MPNRRSPLAHALGTLAIGAALVLISSVGAQATDAIDDPVRQPHLKSWSNVIPNPDRRFIVLADFNNEAVLDRETGLVWERDPTAIGSSGQEDAGLDSWTIATFKCIRKAVGNRKGWRLPAAHELASLVDVTVPRDAIRLPSGHPFQNIGVDFYWTATTHADDTNRAWVVRFLGGGVVTDDKPVAHPFWCVRSGGPLSVY